MAKARIEQEDVRVSEINLRVLAALAPFASKDQARPYITGVCLEIEQRVTTYIATDGHRLVCYRDESLADQRDNRLTGMFIVPARHCKVYKLGKEDLGRATIFEQRGGRLSLAYNMVDVTFAPIPAPYPNWRRTVPRAKASGILAQYSFKFLDDFRKLATELSLPVPFLVPNGDGPAFLWFSGCPHLFGMIMPHRAVDQSEHRAESWALRGGPVREQTDIEDEDFMAHPAEGDDDAAGKRHLQ